MDNLRKQAEVVAEKWWEQDVSDADSDMHAQTGFEYGYESGYTAALSSTVPNAVVEKMAAALLKIIEMNRQHAEDQYGDPEKAETWACIVVSREALKEYQQLTQPLPQNGK